MSPISKVLLHRQFSGKSASHDVGYHAKPVLLEHEFTLLSSFITQYSGIKVPPAKKTMLESRLAKRLRALRIGSFIEYADYLFSPTAHDREIPLMINAITTNKTEFFREPSHFEYLSASALPELVKRTSRHHQPTIHAWSAGCSSGEEAYTMAMVLSEFTDKYPETVFSVLATDVCTTVLQQGKTGIYEKDKVQSVVPCLKRKYFMRGKNDLSGFFRIVPELRAKVRFQHLNLMDEPFNIGVPMEIIFCRNVLIYFERKTQEHLINKFHDHLAPGGYLFLGHSESLNGMSVNLKQVSSAVYRKTG